MGNCRIIEGTYCEVLPRALNLSQVFPLSVTETHSEVAGLAILMYRALVLLVLSIGG